MEVLGNSMLFCHFGENTKAPLGGCQAVLTDGVSQAAFLGIGPSPLLQSCNSSTVNHP